DPPSNIYQVGHLSATAPARVFYTYLNSYIQLQWVSSHAGIPGDEIADDLAKAAANDLVDPEKTT
ncbi:hypothetical protein TNCV_319811, partial [Trichonephila clavipes]